MAHCNNIFIRFINYIAVLMLLFTSSAFAYEGDGGSFGGGGASGSWGEGGCTVPSFGEPKIDSSVRPFYSTGLEACTHIQSISKTVFTGSIFKHEMVFSGTAPTFSCKIGNTINTFKISCPVECPSGYESINGKCQPKKCPVGQTLVNGKCEQKKCPAGQALDLNGNCMPPDDQCPAGQSMVNGRCATDPDDPDDDPDSQLPPFCEWAAVMCQWHKEWQQWSNDYAANEQKANLDREELKRLALDSKEYLSDITTNTNAANQKLDALKIPLDQIKDQDKQFYDELRLWLQNFDSKYGAPSEQNPSIEFPEFCDWSVQMCNWYLDWKDWRTDYKANNEFIKQKLDEHLARLKEMKEQDQEHYEESKSFFDDVRDFFDWYKDQANNPDDPNDPTNPNNDNGNVDVQDQQVPIDDSKKINFIESCPSGEQFTVSFMGQTQNLEFSYQPLCQFMSMIRPFVIAIAYLIGAYILMGLSRGSSE